MRNHRRLSDEAVKAAQDAVAEAMGHVQDYVTGSARRLSDLYTGRTKGGTLLITPPTLPMDGIPIQQLARELETGGYSTGTTVLNLLTSRLVQIYVAQTPGRPTLNVVPKNGAAARLAEQQDELVDFWVEGSRMEEAVRRAAWLDPLQCHVGVRLCKNPRARGPYDMVEWKVIEADDCGYEPFSRRFKWHARRVQWGSLDKDMQERILDAHPGMHETPKPWSAVALTEVFDEALALEENDSKRKGCRVHVFANLAGKFYKDKRYKKPDIGTYIVTYDVRRCPLIVTSNMPTAPDEDVAPVEAAQWVGLLDAISDAAEQLRRETNSTNNVVLYDTAAFDPQQIEKFAVSPTGHQVLLGVATNGEPKGVSDRMRPVERNSIISELITSVQTYLALLDDITGVGPQDRGISVNPSKSATEAATLSASSSRRTAARLNHQANRWEEMARIMFDYQREFFGDTVETPGNGIVRVLPVPSPEQAHYEFKVALDEMENLSRRGRLDTHMMMHTVLTRDAATFVQGVPKLVRESQRRLLKSAGWTDIDLYLDRPVIEGGPEDRYIAALETGKDIPVYEDDDHALFISYYGKIMERAVASGQDGVPTPALQQALQRHQTLLRARDAAAINNAANPSPVPGMSGQGEVDNAMRQQLQLGLPPQMSPQMLQ